MNAQNILLIFSRFYDTKILSFVNKSQSLTLQRMFQTLTQASASAFEELRVNRLRTFLSLLGITIGIFCVISVLTVFESLQNNIQNSMQTLGSQVLYIGKFPWIPEDKGEYAWWKYKARPMNTLDEVKQIEKNASYASFATFCYTDESQKISFNGNELNSVMLFAVSQHFEKLQPIDIELGRYFSGSEIKSGHSNGLVIGTSVAEELFGANISPLGKMLMIYQKPFQIIGVMKKQGKTFTGFDFDGGIILSYPYLASFRAMQNADKNGFADPMIMVKSKNALVFEEMKYQIKSILRAKRKISPKEKDNFSFNQLDAIQNSINDIFVNIKVFGFIIGFFSLLVGSFGIANIMFVSVRERTRQIGIKKALGALSKVILIEFLIESIILCIIGGLFGIILVIFLGKLLSGPIGFPITLSSFNFMLGIIVSILVGMFAGFVPARRASRLNPVVAIQS